MARKRMLQPTMWDDPDLAAVTPTERLLFIGLISLADDYGHVTANPLQLRKAIFGYDNFTVEDVCLMRDHLLAACHNLELYIVEGQEYIWLKQWERHQDLRYRARAQHPCHACGKYHEAKDWDGCKDLPVACDDLSNDDASTTQGLRKDCASTTQTLRKPLRPNYVTLDNDTLDNVTSIHVADSIADDVVSESTANPFPEGSPPADLAELLRGLILSNDDASTTQALRKDCASTTQTLRKPLRPNYVTLDNDTLDNVTSIHVADSIADDVVSESTANPFPEGSPPADLAELLRGLILSNNPQAKVRNQTEKQFAAWCAEIDRMLRLDGRSPTDIERVIRWAQSDTFWRANILSPPKLREKWDTLWLQMQRPSKEVSSNGKIRQRLTEVDDSSLDRFKAFD